MCWTKKLLFLRKKTSVVKSETHFSRETIETIFSVVQDYTENANGDVPLMVENVWYFSFFEFKVRIFSFFMKLWFSTIRTFFVFFKNWRYQKKNWR